ncbi:MAG: phage major capsid protein [Firmicutes bacterium]|nr:phage major capsid protein [Bacillota bacterium]
MINLTTADRVLKDVYLSAVCEQMNKKVHPFFAAIDKGAHTLDGKRAVVPLRYGLKGSLTSTTELGELPSPSQNLFFRAVVDLANIYGTLEISDKAIRVSQNSEGSFVNLLNYEMDTLLESAKFNFSRMLWQNGNGVVGVVRTTNASSVVTVNVHNTASFREGLVLDLLTSTGTIKKAGMLVVGVDRTDRVITFSPGNGVAVTEGDIFTIQGSHGKELLGIPYLFDSTLQDFYGNPRSVCSAILPFQRNGNRMLGTNLMQTMVDAIEEAVETAPNMVLTGFDIRRKYLIEMNEKRTNVDYMVLDGGFHAMSYNGIPIIADRFCTETAMFFLNTDDFKLMELCDWEWIEGDNGRVLMQIPNKPAYTATLVKYANLICVRPHAQAKLFNL